VRHASLSRPDLMAMARVEIAIFDQDIAARFGVAAVVVEVRAVNGDATDSDVVAENRVNRPERSVDEFDTFDQNFAARYEFEHGRPQPVSLAVKPFVKRCPFTALLAEVLLVGLLAGFPCGEVLRALPVDGTASRDGDILHVAGIDERRVVEHFSAFPARQNDGQVVAFVGAENQYGAFGEMQIDVAFHYDGPTAEIASGSEHHATAALIRTAVDGGLNGRSVVIHTVACCSEIADRKFGIGKYRCDDLPFDAFHVAPCGSGRRVQCDGRQHQQE